MAWSKNEKRLRRKKVALLKAIADWVTNDSSLPLPEDKRAEWKRIVGRDDLINKILDMHDSSDQVT